MKSDIDIIMKLIYMNQKEIGKTIYLLRKKHNMTQVQLAECLSVTRVTVSKWERGICIPSLSHLLLIGRMFKVSMEDIIRNRIK